MNASMAATTAPAAVRVERWPSEVALRIAIILISLGLWAMLALTIIGLVYALMIGLFLFFAHVAFIAHVRGSGVRVGPGQFPEIWDRIVALSHAAGMRQPPEAYIMQAGGELNAFATKFLGGRMMVLYSELLEACADDAPARDMVIGHELGHLALRHLDWFLLTAPGRLIPFLGSAYSRACEYSCDRYGAHLCGDPDGATRGLAILAAGPRLARRVNLQAFVAQRRDMDTGWMTIGSWLSGYPPLSARIEALEPALGRGVPYSTRGSTRAVFLLVGIVVGPTMLILAAGAMWAAFMATQFGNTSAFEAAAFDMAADAAEPAYDADTEATMRSRVEQDFRALGDLVRAHRFEHGEIVADMDTLQALWIGRHPDTAFPLDPYDGEPYGYVVADGQAELFSAGGASVDVFATVER